MIKNLNHIYLIKINDFIELIGVKNQDKYTEIPKMIAELKEKFFEIKEQNKIVQIDWLCTAAYEKWAV